jgi:hypothetical protein
MAAILSYHAVVAAAAPTATPTLLDALAASYTERTVAGRPVSAGVERVAAAIHATPLHDAKLARLLIGARRLGRARHSDSAMIADVGDGGQGMTRLAETATEVVVGFVGRPWPGAAQLDVVLDADGWKAYEPSDAVKVAFSIRCGATGYGTLLVAETRVIAGAGAAQAFKRYWRLIRPGAALVHASLLRAIARRATRDAAATGTSA